MGRVQSATRALNPGPKAFLPLTFGGKLDGVQYGPRICEFWLGPTGDSIYHFHEEYPLDAEAPVHIGMPVHIPRKKLDPGFVFVFVRSNNPIWWPIIFNSVRKQFEDAKLFLGNGPAPSTKGFLSVPSEYVPLQESLKGLYGTKHKLTGKISPEYSKRFLGKLALGIGGLFLDHSFRGSQSASLLRTCLWAANITELRSVLIRGSGFLGGIDKRVRDSLKWPGGHTLALFPSRDFLILYAAFFERQAATILISNEPSHWKTLGNEGVAYVISPALRRFAGPVRGSGLVAHKLGFFDPELEALESLEKQTPQPTFVI